MNDTGSVINLSAARVDELRRAWEAAEEEYKKQRVVTAVLWTMYQEAVSRAEAGELTTSFGPMVLVTNALCEAYEAAWQAECFADEMRRSTRQAYVKASSGKDLEDAEAAQPASFTAPASQRRNPLRRKGNRHGQR